MCENCMVFAGILRDFYFNWDIHVFIIYYFYINYTFCRVTLEYVCIVAGYGLLLTASGGTIREARKIQGPGMIRYDEREGEGGSGSNKAAGKVGKRKSTTTSSSRPAWRPHTEHHHHHHHHHQAGREASLHTGLLETDEEEVDDMVAAFFCTI